jgi:sugar (pentulose or hexulose) kinase
VLPDANVSAIGAALLGGLAVEAFSEGDVEALGLATNRARTVEPEEDSGAYADAYRRYAQLYAPRAD